MQFVFKSLRDTYCRVKHLENEGKLRRISNANTKCHYMYKNVPVAESTQSCLGLFIKRTIQIHGCSQSHSDAGIERTSLTRLKGFSLCIFKDHIFMKYTLINAATATRQRVRVWQRDMHNDTCTRFRQPRERKPITTVREREAQQIAQYIPQSSGLQIFLFSSIFLPFLLLRKSLCAHLISIAACFKKGRNKLMKGKTTFQMQHILSDQRNSCMLRSPRQGFLQDFDLTSSHKPSQQPKNEVDIFHSE